MGMRILIIEDNEGDQLLLKEAFEQAGFLTELVFVSSGEEGISKAATIKPDIVIADTNLPGLNGFETCLEIKKNLGDSVKVIMMTGVIDAVDVGRAKKVRADGYCVKTADWENLMETVKLYLKSDE